MPGFFTSARRAKDYPVAVGGVTGVTEAVMHRMSFDIGTQQTKSVKKSGRLPAILLFATVIILAWSLEPMLKAIVSP